MASIRRRVLAVGVLWQPLTLVGGERIRCSESVDIIPHESPGSSGLVEGQSDSSPMDVSGVVKEEMGSFLGFVHFGMHHKNNLSLESRTHLLSFSTVTRSELDMSARSILSKWSNGAYQELCQRTDTPSEGEGEKPGLSTVRPERQTMVHVVGTGYFYRLVRSAVSMRRANSQVPANTHNRPSPTGPTIPGKLPSRNPSQLPS